MRGQDEQQLDVFSYFTVDGTLLEAWPGWITILV
jgi:hypothetical protein